MHLPEKSNGEAYNRHKKRDGNWSTKKETKEQYSKSILKGEVT